MIQSKLITAKGQIITDVFPDAMDLKEATRKPFVSCEARYHNIECKFIECRFKDFTILKQLFNCTDNAKMEVDYEGEPFLLIGIDRKGEVLRTRDTERCWSMGESNLTISPKSDKAINLFPQNTSLEFFNIILPKRTLEKYCEIHPSIIEPFLKPFSMDAPFYFKKKNLRYNKTLSNLIFDIEHCCSLGNCADNFLENKILDSLSIMINRVEGSEKNFSPTNIVLLNKIKDAGEIVKQKYKEPLSLEDLAKEVGTNVCTLKSVFKQEFGKTVFQYLYEYRMDLAKHLLEETNLPILEIGLRLGYEYQSHFCLAFKRKYGISPSDFRKNLIQQ